MIVLNYGTFKKPQFVVISDQHLRHSAKGSTWENHKYIKRIDGTYYYPDSYEGGRHLPDEEKNDSDSHEDDIISKLESMTGMTKESLIELRELSRKSEYDSDEFKEMLNIISEGDPQQINKIIDLLEQERNKVVLSPNDIENLAREVIRGNFGSGQERKDLLGENYEEIQKRVNELMKGSTGSKKISEASEESIKKVEEVAKKVSTPTTNSNVHSGIDINKVLSVYKKSRR